MSDLSRDASELRGAIEEGAASRITSMLAVNPSLLRYEDSGGMTPLHWAAKAQKEESVSALLQLGADTAKKDRLGYRPVDVASWYGEIRWGSYTDACQRILERFKAYEKKA